MAENIDRHEERDDEMRRKAEKEKIAPPPHEPRVGEDYRIHPHPVPGVEMPGEIPGDDLKSGGRSEGIGYDRGSAEGRDNEQFWSGKQGRR